MQHYRQLAAAQPEAFLPDLARSLWVLGDILRALDRSSEAATLLAEALAILVPLVEALREAFLDQYSGTAKSYIECCMEAGVEPDAGLPEPLMQLMERMQAEQAPEQEGQT